ncbi:MAG: hypothetical protein M3O36_12710 [Myxococcota bacterium]|nr:hypothetical protein [Myxococcota bacterium]
MRIIENARAFGGASWVRVWAWLGPALLGLLACGTTPRNPGSPGPDGGAAGGGASDDAGLVTDEASLPVLPGDDSAVACLTCGDSSAPPPPMYVQYDGGRADLKTTAPDCAGCTFPPLTGAPACPATTPSITVVYPPDTVLLPPNMNVISVQWTPFGAPFTQFEIDLQNASTDIRIVTKCATQTVDTGQPPMPSGGCEHVLTPTEWQLLATANRGGSVVNVSVRGTTDGACAVSSKAVQISFAEQDLLGTYYYWKSTVSANGVGGQIWKKTFGDLATQELNVTGSLQTTCNGCHVLSRDGSRMIVYADDNDSDDEYSDVGGSLLDMTVNPPIPLGTACMGTRCGGGGGGRRGGGGAAGWNGQPPGFSTLNPTALYYLTSNGLPIGPTNVLALWSGQTGTTLSSVTFGAAVDRPTMPDWSPDGKSVIYTLPSAVANWGGATGNRNDDDHMFGGSLYTLPYMGNQVFGTPALFLQSAGENNYYPSYSPDAPSSFVIFDRARLDMSAGGLTACMGGQCPNDSFSNPAARLMLTSAAQGQPVIDLEKANGSPAAAPVNLSNSYPKWAPFVQTYKGQKLLWFAFSSTRDYGVLVRNHKTGMYQCYPADAYQTPGAAHQQPFAPLCQQPQLWMAPISVTEGFDGKSDPSRVAFWLPYQDPTTHNHTPQWTQQPVSPPPPPAQCIPSGGNCLINTNACCNSPGASILKCTGNGLCGQVVN